jgi:hypothetical protein
MRACPNVVELPPMCPVANVLDNRERPHRPFVGRSYGVKLREGGRQ